MTDKLMDNLPVRGTQTGGIPDGWKDPMLGEVAKVQIEGERQVARSLDFYNLDAIISVGYRVNSYQATQFRIWATKTP